MLIDLLREVFRKPARPALEAPSPQAPPEQAKSAIEQGRLNDAIVILRRAAIDEPENAGVFLARARVARDLGMLDEAIDAFGAAKRLLPGSVEIVHNLGAAHEAAGNLLEARAHYEDVIARRPEFAAAHLNLGNVRRSLGDLAGAASAYEHALSLRQDSAKAHGNLANLRRRQGMLGPAEDHFRRAIELDPADLRWLFGLGSVLHDLRHLDAAIDIYRRILERNPGDEKASHNHAYALLARGDFARGWIGTATRFDLSEGAVPRHPCPAAPWCGEPLGDGALLVWGEQGVGDELLFAGMYPELALHARRIVLECKPKLQSLFARSFPWALVVAGTMPADDRCLAGIDRQIAAGSLGAILRPSLDAFPARAGYLRADAGRVQRWKQRLSALGRGAKIGFCWRSSNMQGERALSCPSLEEWSPLFAVPGVHWICLQYDECRGDLERARNRFAVELHRFDEIDYFDDLDEVAALNCALDLAISAPTTVSVLSAALGVPTWQLSFGCDWQTHGTDHNPWLPAMTRFERRWDQTWPAIIGDVAARLRARVASST